MENVLIITQTSEGLEFKGNITPEFMYLLGKGMIKVLPVNLKTPLVADMTETMQEEITSIMA